jgi:hypothetical protein
LIDLRQAALVTLDAYAAQVPLFLVWLAGIALAVRSWRRQGTISLLTVIAIGLASVNSLCWPPTSTSGCPSCWSSEAGL